MPVVSDREKVAACSSQTASSSGHGGETSENAEGRTKGAVKSWSSIGCSYRSRTVKVVVQYSATQHTGKNKHRQIRKVNTTKNHGENYNRNDGHAQRIDLIVDT